MDESQNIEYKAIWKDEYYKWICGFANAIGGRIFLGVDDDPPHKPVGLDNADKLMEDLPNKVRDVLGIMVDVNLHHDYWLLCPIILEAPPIILEAPPIILEAPPKKEVFFFQYVFPYFSMI